MRAYPTVVSLFTAATLLLAPACEPAPSYSGTVCLDVTHHGVPQHEATIFHDVGTADFPGYHSDMRAVYDEAIPLQGSHQICIPGLSVGQHWFVGEGYDRLIRDSVRGSLSLYLTTRASRVDTVLRVSERH